MLAEASLVVYAITGSTDWFSTKAWTTGRLIALGTMIIAGGVFFTGSQVLSTRKSRTIQIAQGLADKWESEKLVAARSLLRHAEDGSPEAIDRLRLAVKAAYESIPPSDDFYQYTRFLNFFEQMGVAFKNHRQGLRVVNDLLGGTVMDWWETWETVIPYVWDRPGKPTTVGENFGILYKKLRRYRKRLAWRKAIWEKLTEIWDYQISSLGG